MMQSQKKAKKFKYKLNCPFCQCCNCGLACAPQHRDFYFYNPKKEKGLKLVEPPSLTLRGIFVCGEKRIKVFYTGENEIKLLGTLEDPYGRYGCLENKCFKNGQCICNKDILLAQNGFLDINLFAFCNCIGLGMFRFSIVQAQCLTCRSNNYDIYKKQNRKFLITYPTCQPTEFVPSVAKSCVSLNFKIKDMNGEQVGKFML